MLFPVGSRWLAAVFALGFCTTASADDVLFENVRIFDGKSAALSAPSNVLVKGSVIERISTAPIAVAGALRIAGNGRTLMPGLIDNHWHAIIGTSATCTDSASTSAIPSKGDIWATTKLAFDVISAAILGPAQQQAPF